MKIKEDKKRRERGKETGGKDTEKERKIQIKEMGEKKGEMDKREKTIFTIPR